MPKMTSSGRDNKHQPQLHGPRPRPQVRPAALVVIENLEGRQLMAAQLDASQLGTTALTGGATVMPLAVAPALQGTDFQSTGGSTTVVAEGTDYDLTSTGDGISGRNDSFRFQHRQVTGDFDVVVRVAGVSGSDARSKAGLMARGALTDASRNVFVGLSRADGYRFSYRTSEGASTTNYKTGTSRASVYLRLRRTGNTFAGYRSADGVTWTKISEKTMSMPSTVHLGLAVSGTPEASLATAAFRGYAPRASIIPTPTPTPTPTTAPTIAWSAGADAPYRSQEGLNLRVGNLLFYMGGFIDNEQNTTNQAWVQNIDTGTWTRIANLPLTQTHSGIASDGRSLWLAGGIVGTSSSGTKRECFRYDIASNTWETFPALPQVRIGGGLVYLDGRLHFFGGAGADRITVSSKHWAIDVDAAGRATSGWTSRADMINPGDHFSPFTHEGKIYALGGEHDHGRSYTQHNVFSVYDPATDAWRSLAPMPVASSHMEASTVLVHGRLVVMGGQRDDEQLMKDIRVYDFAGNKWQQITSLPSARKGAVAYFHNDELHFFSGRGFNSSGSKENFKNQWIGKISNPWW